MKEKQLSVILSNMNVSPENERAVKLVILQGYTVYRAEKEVFGRTTNTISRLRKKIMDKRDHCIEVVYADAEDIKE